MPVVRRDLTWIGLVLLLLGGRITDVERVRAQAPDSGSPGTVLAQFDDARAVAADPRGRVYVADAGRDVVKIFGPDGTPRVTLGGSGTGPGGFDTPSDVDPTNGQLLLVADTYNGRVQRFSGEGQYLESLPVGPERSTNQEWTFEEGRSGTPVRGRGAPIAVARSDDGAVFVLDARDRRLLRWSELGQSGSLVVGREGRLQDPVALAVGPAGQIYVADAGRESVLVYDAFGTFRRRLAGASVRALAVHRGQLWGVCDEQVLVWDRTGGLVAEYTVDLSEPLVDVAFAGGDAYLLTETQLRRRPEWPQVE